MSDEPELSFENALKQIEQIVDDLERGEPELTAALAKYETSVRLLAHCYEVLDRAERSVALLTGVDEQGNPVTAPFDTTAAIEREKNAAPPANSAEEPRDPMPEEKPGRTRRPRPSTAPKTEPIEPPF